MSEKHTQAELSTTKIKSDEELVAMIRCESRIAFGELYSRYKGRLLYFCNRFTKDNTIAEDLVQDIFIQIWETRDMLNPDLSFSGYVHTIAQNRIISFFRKIDIHSRFVCYMLKNQSELTTQTEYMVVNNDYTELLDKAIETLSPKQKEVFTLSRMQGLTYKKISEKLRISVPTVQEHASLALHKIKEYLSRNTDICFKLFVPIVFWLSI